jgi:uncharacterized protein YqfB (UPF0267 family)
MPALNFQKQFAELVKSGKKTITIRKVRKSRPIAEYDALYLYTGMRTNNCTKLAEAVALFVVPITITEQPDDFRLEQLAEKKINFLFHGHRIGETVPEFIARRDGFESYHDMVNYFKSTYGVPFTGVLIGWKLIAENVELCDRCPARHICAEHALCYMKVSKEIQL